MRSHALLAVPFLLVVACGSQVGSSSTSSNSGNDSDTETDTPGRWSPDGSFDLTFVTVTATPTYASSLPSVAPPSIGANAMLRVADGAPTMLTPRWGTPAELDATLTNSAFELQSGTVTISDDTTYFVTDTWTDFEIDREDNGTFTGAFSAKGTEEISDGDEIFEATLVGTGKIAGDTTPPDVRLGTLPPNGLMPWEPIPVQLAEPVTKPASRILSLSPAAAAGVVTPSDANSLRADVLASAWSNESVNVVAQAMTDLAGNSIDTKTFPVTFFDPGAPAAAFSFDSATANPSKWDDASLITFMNADASCESGGCAKIGPLGDHGCTIPNAGLAGILEHDASHASTLFVRYRILVGIDPTAGGTSSVTPDPGVFSVETATPGQSPTTQPIGFALADLKTIPSTFGMTQATDWATATIPLPAASELGVRIGFGSGAYCGGPILNENSTIVLIDSITAD